MSDYPLSDDGLMVISDRWDQLTEANVKVETDGYSFWFEVTPDDGPAACYMVDHQTVRAISRYYVKEVLF